MREFILDDGSALVMPVEVDLVEATTMMDKRRRFLVVPSASIESTTQESPSGTPQACLFDPAGPSARAGFFCA